MCLAYLMNNYAMLMFTLIYSCFALTTSVTEAFPMNLLFSILLAYYITRVYSTFWPKALLKLRFG